MPCDNKHVAIDRFDVMINYQPEGSDKGLIKLIIIQLKI